MQALFRTSGNTVLGPIGRAASAWLWTFAILILYAPEAVQGQTVYHSFTLVDTEERRLLENAYIVVEGTRIVEVGTGAPPRRDRFDQVDMSGRYALPGFIDAHAHVTVGVRSIDMNGGAPLLRERHSDEITRFQALVALSAGVTTIRNPAGVPEAGPRYAGNVRSGSWLGPDILQAGSLFGGRPWEWALHPANEQEWREAMDREVQAGSDYVKLYTGLSELELAQGIEAAHARGLETIAHLDRVSWARAAELGVDALTHALPTSEDLLVEPARSAYIASRAAPSAKFMYQWWEWVDLDSEPVQRMIRLLVERQVLVDLTLGVNEIVYWFNEVDSLPFMPVDAWMHPEHRGPWREQMGGSLYDWTDADFARARAIMPKVLEFARRLHLAGVPLLLGTDGTGGGPLLAREMELHVEAGLSIWDVLALATTEAAERLGIAERTGALRANFEADIVFIEANPLDNISNVGQVEVVVLDGRAYRASDLMEQAAGLVE